MPNDIVRASATAFPNPSRRSTLGLFVAAPAAMLAFASREPAIVDPETELFALRNQIIDLKHRKNVVDADSFAKNDVMLALWEKSEGTQEAVSRAWDVSGLNEAVDLQEGLLEQLEAMCVRANQIRPRSLAGAAALAQIFKCVQGENYWDEAEHDRDWEVLHLTKLVDRLIELGMSGASAAA